MIELILGDLKARYGDRVLLTPEDLVEVLGVSVGQQANLRSAGRFPIPTRKIGNLIKVTIYDLASYLSGLCSADVKKQVKIIEDDEKLPRVEKKKRRGHLESDWYLSYQQLIYFVLDKTDLNTKTRTLTLLRKQPISC